MRVRLTTRADLARVIDIACEAFVDDELFVYLCPGRKLYPEAWRRYMTARQRRHLYTPGCWGIVCVDDQDMVLGFAWWYRGVPDSMLELKSGDLWLKNNSSWQARLESLLLKAESRYSDFFKLNPAEDHETIQKFRSADDSLMAPIEKATVHWYLAVLAVAPGAQRTGVGSMLVDWGISSAQEESLETDRQVPLLLTSSGPGFGLYSKKGFRVIGWQKLVLEHGDQFGWLGGAGFVYDPTDTYIKSAETGMESAPGRPIGAVWTERALSASTS